MTVDEQDSLPWMLAAWRAHIDSVSIPQLLTVDAAIAVITAARHGQRGRLWWRPRRRGIGA